MHHQLVIIGSGPAGLTAALYAGRANIDTCVLLGDKPGGQLMGTTTIENWPGSIDTTGPQLMMTIMDQVKKYGAHLKDGSATNIDTREKPFKITLENSTSLTADSIILASGVTPNKLHCPGEETYWGAGVSTCAVCDGALYKDKHIVIVGGGDGAMESASFLRKMGNTVTIIHILDTLTASHIMQQRILNDEGVTIIYKSTVTEILGDGTNVTQAKIQHQKTQKESFISCDAVFLAIGAKPNSHIVKPDITTTGYGHVHTHDHVKTNIPGIFAAGDVQDFKYRQAIVSAGFGCMAALEAQRYLENQEAR